MVVFAKEEQRNQPEGSHFRIRVRGPPDWEVGHLGKEAEASFKVEYDVTGRAQCRQCKKKMNKTELRMGKLVGNFSDKSRKGMIYHYFHPNCLIQNLKRCRIMSRNIETADSIFGIDNLRASDYALISSLVEDLLVHKASKKSMQLVTSHKVRTVKQPAVNNQCHSQLKRAKNRRLKVLYCNADTFTQEKKHELQVLMAEDQPDIVAITEVNPKGRSYKIEDIKIREYITFDSNLRCVGRSGVAVLVHSSLEHSVSALEANTEFQESLWLNFKLQNGDNLLFGNVYRSPISSEENDGALNLVMGKMCSPAPGRFSHICVVGDFNFPRIRWSATHATPVESKEAKFIDIIEECYLYQHINRPTRCRGDDMPSQLDLIFTNELEMVSDVQHMAPLGKSVNQMLKFNFNCYAEYTGTQQRFNYNRGDYEDARQELQEVPITAKGSVQQMWDTIKDRVIGLRNDHVPTIQTGGRKWKSNYSHDKEVLDLIREKARCHRFWVARQHDLEGLSARQSYNQARNQVRKRTRQLRKQYELNIANQSMSNPKVFWRFARDRLKTKIGVAPLLCNPDDPGTLRHSDEEKADILQSQFCSVFTREPEGEIPQLEPRIGERLERLVITHEWVLKALIKTNVTKSCGPD